MSFTTIPNELILNIAKQLPADDLSRLSRTNHTFTCLLSSPFLCRAGHSDLERCIVLNRPASLRSILRSNTINIDNKIRAPGSNIFTWPLHQAALDGSAEIVALLIGHGAPVDELERDDIPTRVTTLQCAVRSGSVETVTLVLDAGANPDRTSDHDYSTPLETACLNHREDLAHLLVNRGARLGGNVLIAAAYSGCLTVIERLLDMGVPVDSTNASPMMAQPVSALQYVCILSPPAACASAESLLRRGADVNRVCSGRAAMFPLYCAVRGNRTALARILLAFGADRDMLYEGKTMAAIAEKRGHHDVLALLVSGEE